MEYEFDRVKSASNRRKHGVDFVEAQALWEDPDRVEIPPRTEDDFPVWMVESLDREASRLGVPRQSLIKMLIARHFGESRSS